MKCYAARRSETTGRCRRPWTSVTSICRGPVGFSRGSDNALTCQPVHAIARATRAVNVYWLRARMWRIADFARRFQPRGKGILWCIRASENFF